MTNISDLESRLQDLTKEESYFLEFGEWKSEKAKVIHLLLLFDQQVSNGGLTQWYGNPTGEFTEETIKSFRRISCDTIAQRITKFCVEAFKSSKNETFERRSKSVSRVISDLSIRNRVIEEFDYWYEEQRYEYLQEFCSYIEKE